MLAEADQIWPLSQSWPTSTKVGQIWADMGGRCFKMTQEMLGTLLAHGPVDATAKEANQAQTIGSLGMSSPNQRSKLGPGQCLWRECLAGSCGTHGRHARANCKSVPSNAMLAWVDVWQWRAPELATAMPAIARKWALAAGRRRRGRHGAWREG